MKDQLERLLQQIRNTCSTPAKLRDLIDACEDYLRELDLAEYTYNIDKYSNDAQGQHDWENYFESDEYKPL
jgi:hypothetical protein